MLKMIKYLDYVNQMRVNVIQLFLWNIKFSEIDWKLPENARKPKVL